MSRKRRVFDIDMPEDLNTSGEAAGPNDPGAAGGTFPAGKDEDAASSPALSSGRSRRGPMATAISETVHSARERTEVEARIRAENDALAHEHVRLKSLGLVVDLIPLDAVDMAKLSRDRAPGVDPELAELTASIRELGLSNPIRVEAKGDGRFELIQGFRRLSAYRALLAETGDADRWGVIPAAVVPEGGSLDDLYRKMVDENLVRKDISFAEMAQLAVDFAADPNTQERDADKAVALLFKSAGYSKRSYIRGFIKLVQALGVSLRFPAAIPRALGLNLVQQMDKDPNLAAGIRAALAAAPGRDEAAELAILRGFVGGTAEPEPARAPKGKPSPSTAKAKTSFQLDRREGRAKCTAAAGRLEIKLDRDFTTVDRRKLEAAIAKLLDAIE